MNQSQDCITFTGIPKGNNNIIINRINCSNKTPSNTLYTLNVIYNKTIIKPNSKILNLNLQYTSTEHGGDSELFSRPI